MLTAAHILGDALTWLAYMGLSGWCWSVSRRMHGRVQTVGRCFAGFIFLCGLTHLWGLWAASHGYCEIGSPSAAAVKLMTGVVSIGTMGFVFHLTYRNRSRILDLGSENTMRTIARLKTQVEVLEARQGLLDAAKAFLELVM